MRHTFKTEQWLPYPVEVVFAFFANPENLPRLLPGWQKARIEEATFAPTPPRPQVADQSLRIRTIAAGPGTRITLSFRPFPFSPIRVPWDAEIDSFEWNDHFCDNQLRGPFAYWHHCHRISPETRDSLAGALLRDEVEYEMHLGALGELAHTLFVAAQLRRVFAFRHQRTAQLLPLMRAPRSVLSSTGY
jgi:ligand-binding SRPBCC domain-containing protein